MRSWRRVAPLWMAATLVTGAAADEPVSEARDVSQPFTEVRLTEFELELTQGDAVSLTIEAPRADLPLIRSDVSNGVLTLRWEETGPLGFLGWHSRHRRARVRLTAKSIERLVVAGSGSVHSGSWTSPALELSISGSGAVKLDRLRAARLTCDVTGGGDIQLAGSATHQKIRISGSGNYLAPELMSQSASASITGSGKAELWVQRTLHASITGSGDVRYYGTPTLTQSVSGSGRVTSLGAKEPTTQD
jgi:hypothetical protein